MTRQQEMQLANHLERIGQDHGPIVCPVCRATAWGFGGITAADPTAGAMAQAICKSCGNVLLFDCRIAGVVV